MILSWRCDYLLDSSTVVKRYAQETGTPWVQALAAPTAGHLLVVVRITLAETVAAITRKERGSFITPQAAATAQADFQLDFAQQYAIVEVPPRWWPRPLPWPRGMG